MEPELPFEFNVRGRPTSLQGSPSSRETWKQKIRLAARAALPEGAWALDKRLEVTILIFSDDEMQGDLDNRIKAILDALAGVVFLDDDRVDRLLVQRFDPVSPCKIINPSATLRSAIGASQPIVYIRIEDEPNRERFI
jgi:Holliday junction resolvase RusA-like endonuclease